MQISDLPASMNLFDKNFLITFGQSIVGNLLENIEINFIDPSIMSLKNALIKSFSDLNSCFITFSSATFAAIKSAGKYFVIDSHS